MPRRHILTERQRNALFVLPTDEGSLLQHYILDDDDIEHIRTRRHAHNKLGFALQLCAMRHPGRLLTAGEVIPLTVTAFLAVQIGVKLHELAGYTETDVTRRRHLIDLRLPQQHVPKLLGMGDASQGLLRKNNGGNEMITLT